MKSIFTPEDRRELYNGVTNPREELLGDTLELALGILTMAIRYPNHFINWGGSDGANADACVRGIERSIWRDEDIENYIRQDWMSNSRLWWTATGKFGMDKLLEKCRLRRLCRKRRQRVKVFNQKRRTKQKSRDSSSYPGTSVRYGRFP